MEKYKKEMKEKDEKLEEMTKKVFQIFAKIKNHKIFQNNMTKSRSQTLQNQVRILKEQMVALEEKGRHDDELVDALTARLKSKGDKFIENGDRP